MGEDNLHKSDEALLRAAQTGDGVVELTPDMLARMADVLNERAKECEDAMPKLVEACPYQMRLAVTAQVFKAIVDHAADGGTFRYLIYERLGFGADAYVPLYLAGGMTISNEFELGTTMESTEDSP